MNTIRFLPADVTRCANADQHDCEERHNCARWMLRAPASQFALWADYASRRDDQAQECRFFWPMTTSAPAEQPCEWLLV
jgi:hypothetical protein